MENPRKNHCLNIIVNISSFNSLNTNMNTTLKYYRKQETEKFVKSSGSPSYVLNVRSLRVTKIKVCKVSRAPIPSNFQAQSQ